MINDIYDYPADTNHAAYFRVVPTESGTLTLDTLGSNYDTVIQLYDDQGNKLAEDDE